MQIKVELYVGDIDTHELEALRDSVYEECVHRGLKMPTPNVKIMATAEFKTHLEKVYHEAKMRAIPLPGEPVPPTINVPELNELERAYAESSRKITAIKEFRNRTGLGLRESKDAVDAYVAAWEKFGRPIGGVPKTPDRW